MRLHRLHLRDVKGVADRTVDFPDSGVVIIEGPNEIGKSTLLEAFDMLLDSRAKASSQSKAVKALQPVGRDVGPRVEAEFTVGAYRVRFTKQWLRGAATELEILHPVREHLSGEAAQHRLDQILTESLDRPLWDALRFTQAGELSQMVLTDSAVLTEALDGASGVDLHASDGGPLLDRVEAEFLRYYTPTGRIGAQLKSAIAKTTAARDAAVLAHGDLVETQQLVEEHETLREHAAELAVATDAVRTRLENACERETAVSTIVRAHDESTTALAQARQDSVRAGEDLHRREQALRDLTDARERLEMAEQTAKGDRTALTEAKQQAKQLVVARDSACIARDQAREVAELAAADVEHLQSLAQAADVTDRLERLGGLRTDEASARVEVAAAPEIDASVIGALEAADRDLLQFRARQEASSARVALESIMQSRSVVINGKSVDLPAGHLREVPLLGGIEIELPGELRLIVQPEEGAAQLAAKVERAEVRLTELLAQTGVADLTTAREAATRWSAAETRLRAVCERATDVLGGQRELDLAEEVRSLEEQGSEHVAGRPGDYPLPDDVLTARAVARAAVAALRDAEATLAQAERVLREHERHTSQVELRVEKRLSVLETQHERLVEDRDRVTEARQVASDESLAEAVRDASTAYAKVEARAAVTRRKLEAADVEAVRTELAEAGRTSAEHAKRVDLARQAQARVQGQVELVSGEGRQEVYDQALAEFVRLRQAVDVVHGRARAARQLRETLGRHRDAAHRAYVRPYQDEIRRLGRLVYGDTFDVEIEDNLTIRSRSLDGTSVAFDQLSGGAKEQLGILSRLAVAGLVESGDGVPVIIDDALGYTDPDRLHRVSAVFGDPGEGTQVVLLTCTPERYRQIEGATTIRLTA